MQHHDEARENISIKIHVYWSDRVGSIWRWNRPARSRAQSGAKTTTCETRTRAVEYNASSSCLRLSMLTHAMNSVVAQGLEPASIAAAMTTTSNESNCSDPMRSKNSYLPVASMLQHGSVGSTLRMLMMNA